MKDRYYRKSDGKKFVIEKVLNQNSLDLVIFMEDTFPSSLNDRRYCLDLYSFNSQMEIQLDK